MPLPCFRRYTALYISKHIFSLGEKLDDEIVGRVYLFLKEQLEISKMPPLSGVLHGTIIGAVSNNYLHFCYSSFLMMDMLLFLI